MGSLRSIARESQAEKNRIRSLLKRASALSGLGEPEARAKVNRYIVESRHRLSKYKVLPISEEEGLKIFCGLIEHDLERRKALAVLLGISEETVLCWDWSRFMTVFTRIGTHGCIECSWRNAEVCTHTVGPEPIPEDCPGFQKRE